MSAENSFKETEIGPIPVEWDVVWLGDVLREVNVRVKDMQDIEAKQFPVLSLTKDRGLILQSERFGKRIAKDDVSDYKVVQRGQIVYNPYVIWEGAVHILRDYEYGLVSPVYPVWEAKPHVAHAYFIDHLLSFSHGPHELLHRRFESNNQIVPDVFHRYGCLSK